MTASRVGEVAIRLRLDPALEPRAAELRDVVQRDLVPRVLDELERHVHERLGADVVLRLRRVPFACRLDAGALGEDDLAARLAAEIAAALIATVDRLSPPERLRPRGDEVALFADDDHADAAQLADLADGAPAWFHRGDAPAAWSRVRARGGRALAAVLGWLERMDRADAVLSSPTAPPPAALLAVLARASWPAPSARVIDRLVRHEAARSPAPPPPAAAAAPVEVPALPPAGVSTAAPVAAPAGDLPLAAPVAAPAGDLPLAAAPPAAAPETSSPPPRPEPLPASNAGDVPAHALPYVITDAAGLFYLAGRVLEIDLAERLWAAGLPEGDVLAHVAAALLGRDDVACRWFGGTFAEPPSTPDVAPWAEAELREQVQHALGIRLVRFGISTTPDDLDAALTALAPAFPAVTGVGPSLARTISRAAAALATMTAARLGVPPSAALLRAVCARPGTLVLDDTTLAVELPITHLDLAHRRAGLDHDPGYLPWLRRRVAFTFIGATTL